jgi:hypothetical protein
VLRDRLLGLRVLGLPYVLAPQMLMQVPVQTKLSWKHLPGAG